MTECCLCDYVCNCLDFLVFSDKDDKPLAPSRNSSSFAILWDVKEPTHSSKRVGRGVPGVVVWSCCAHAVLASCIVSPLLGLLYMKMKMFCCFVEEVLGKTSGRAEDCRAIVLRCYRKPQNQRVVQRDTHWEKTP